MTKCVICRQQFTKRSMTHKACSPDCSEQYGREKARQLAEKQKRVEAKRDRLETRGRKEALKSRQDWLGEAQTAVNLFVRLRDAQLPCISCRRYHTGQYHAGHYISRGANQSLRFDTDNIHKQCAPCNSHLSGNQVNYRIGLIQKIGLERVERLESFQEVQKWTVEEIKVIKKTYQQIAKDLKKGTT